MSLFYVLLRFILQLFTPYDLLQFTNLFTIKTSDSTIYHTCLNFNRIYLFCTQWEHKAIFLLGNIIVPISGRQEVVR